jgi:hypothetical protein
MPGPQSQAGVRRAGREDLTGLARVTTSCRLSKAFTSPAGASGAQLDATILRAIGAFRQSWERACGAASTRNESVTKVAPVQRSARCAQRFVPRV